MIDYRSRNPRTGGPFVPAGHLSGPFQTIGTHQSAAEKARAASIGLSYDKGFIRPDGKDVRTLPKVAHPITGKMHYNWGWWP